MSSALNPVTVMPSGAGPGCGWGWSGWVGVDIFSSARAGVSDSRAASARPMPWRRAAGTTNNCTELSARSTWA
ncbi:Uncharacterised protein [Mycobacteroides abscessus subsp. abscessus]|nr:Uncharacterised protein [Mycobacteroides abscessus subsp. abscessus]